MGGWYDPSEVRPSLQLAPGKRTIRLALTVGPSRANTGDGFRVVSEPLEIDIEALPEGERRSWPPGPELAQAVKEAIYRTSIPLQKSSRPQEPAMPGWITEALASSRQATTLVQDTPLHVHLAHLTETLARLRAAVAADPADAADAFAAVGQEYRWLIAVFAGETPPVDLGPLNVDPDAVHKLLEQPVPVEVPPAAEEPDPWAFHRLFEEALRALYEGEPREEVARRMRAITNLPGVPGVPAEDAQRHSVWQSVHDQATELAGLLEQMAREDAADAARGQAGDPAALDLEQRIEHYLHELRDAAAQPLLVPGKANVIHYPDDQNNAAIALRRIGKPAVPALIALLDDRRPTRAISTAFNGSHALRYQDAALQILEAIAGRSFGDFPGRGTYLSNASEEKHAEVVRAAQQWWAANRDKPEAQWLAEALRERGIRLTSEAEAAGRLIALDPALAMRTLLAMTEDKPRDPLMGRLLEDAIAAAPAAARPSDQPVDLVVTLRDADGRPLERGGVALVPASLGQADLPARPHEVNRQGRVLIQGLRPPVQRFVAQTGALLPTFLAFDLTGEPPITAERRLRPQPREVPDLEVTVEREGAPDDPRLKVTIRNLGDKPYQLTDADLQIVSADRRVFDPSPFPWDIAPGAEGVQRLTWSEYVATGLWCSRMGEEIRWQTPDPVPGHAWFRVKVGNTYSNPIALPVPLSNGEVRATQANDEQVAATAWATDAGDTALHLLCWSAVVREEAVATLRRDGVRVESGSAPYVGYMVAASSLQERLGWALEKDLVLYVSNLCWDPDPPQSLTSSVSGGEGHPRYQGEHHLDLSPFRHERRDGRVILHLDPELMIASATSRYNQILVRPVLHQTASVEGRLNFDGPIKAGEALIFIGPMGDFWQGPVYHLIVFQAANLPKAHVAYLTGYRFGRSWVALGEPGMLVLAEEAARRQARPGRLEFRVAMGFDSPRPPSVKG